MSAERQVFDPTALPDVYRRQLIDVVVKASGEDPLSIAGTLRMLADESERLAESDDRAEQLQLAVASSILADLAEQGSALQFDGEHIQVHPPAHKVGPGDSVDRVKDRIRNGLMLASDRQLAEPSTQKFIRAMERVRTYDGKTISVKGLVDNGDELAESLKRIAEFPPEERADKLWRVVRPVVQVCTPEARCEFTGQKLLDVWRFFRHTWSLEYNSVPGRTLRFLIRNKARPNWPVIGIAMLSSPAANMYIRDSWIGWTVDDLMSNVVNGDWDTRFVARRMLQVLRDSISDIRTDDLATAEEIESGEFETIFRLRQFVGKAEADRAKDLKEHGKNPNANRIVDVRSIDKEPQEFTDDDWLRLSETSLYRKKRAEQLIPLLERLRFFKDAGIEKAPAAVLYEILATKKGREAAGFVLTEIRKRALASDIADLSVCGAIAPYNHLLGGKLVALAMASQEVRDFYGDRYREQASEISSQMAGHRVVRPSDLKVVTTTSLYGVGSSQYNRLKLKAGTVKKLFNDLYYEELEQTQGHTVTHVSKRTVNLIRCLNDVIHGHRRVNSVFGEGSSPRTRQIRHGFLMLGIWHNEFMKQPTGRRVYACELYPGARDNLVGMKTKKARGRAARLDPIARAWISRWLVNRIANPAVVDRVEGTNGETISEELRLRAMRAKAEDDPAQPDLLRDDADSIEKSANLAGG